MLQQGKHFYEFGVFRLDATAGVLLRDGKLVALTPKAVETLAALVRGHGQVVTKEELMRTVWPDAFVEEANLNVQISALRKALDGAPGAADFIETVPRRGYRFRADVQEVFEEPAEWVTQRRTLARIVTEEEEITAADAVHPLRTATTPALPAPAALSRWVLPLTGALFLPALLAAVWLGPRMFSARSKPAAMKVVPVTSYPGMEWASSISPDGKYVAFMWNQEGRTESYDLYIQLIGAGEPLRLTSQGARSMPAWSPDGRFLVFTRVTNEKKEILAVPALGGRERKLGEAKDNDQAQFLSWSPDGKWIAYADRDTPQEAASIWLLSPETGERRRFTSPPAGTKDIFPAFSPDGETLAFTRGHTIFLAPLAGGAARPITSGEWSILHLAWTADGQEIVYSGLHSGAYEFWRLPVSSGEARRIPLGQGNFYFPSIARQGQRLALVRETDDWNIWRIPLARPGETGGTPQRWIASTSEDGAPQYSPDGTKIVFGSGRSGDGELWVCEADGSNAAQLTSFPGAVVDTFSWAGDSRSVIVNLRRAGFETYLVNLDGSAPRRLTTDVPIESYPIFSGDGRFVYFGSRKSGASQIWKAPVSGGPATQVTRNGGVVAAESADGKFLYFTPDVNKPGLWRMPLPSGEPSLLIPAAYGWTLAPNGVYFAVASVEGRLGFLAYFDLKTGGMKELYKPKGDFRPQTGHLSVSPDGRHLLYVQTENSNRDVMLIENFQ